jgi:superfamily II DNA or RNA helicase
MDGNVVVFKGSMNETWTGLAADGNLESVDVAATWMGARDTDRARNEEAYFADLWADQYPTLKVRPFPEVARAELSLAAPDDWGSLLERLSEFSGSETMSQDARGRVLLPHQAAGLASWFANDRRGVLAFATGSGKTFTAITAIREALSKRNEIVLVMVPDLALFSQWLAELKEVANDLGAEILRAGAGGVRWKENLHLWTQPGSRRKIVLATLKTAASSEFRNQLPRDARLMLVADEVHRLGSPFHQSLLNSDIFGARLGLSATPERAGDPAGTGAVLAFFGGILEPRYTLADAIRDQVLVPYFYRPHTVEMSPSEAEQWSEMSKTIRRLQARQKDGKQLEPLNQRLKLLLIRRASIVKHAQAKIQLAINVLRQEFQPGQRWIVYCENLAQLDLVSGALEASGFPNMPYHSKMEGDRTETLKWLDRRGGIVVAIKCLDEGVDIPSVTHALILASSRNPREFVQRRGRVLRKAPNKSLAYVHDAIVLPPASEDNAEVGSDPLTAGELARAVHFALDADNPASAADLQNIAIDLGLNWQALLEVGTEDDV